MKLKQFLIFSVLALSGACFTSCDDEKQDIIDDVNITDEQHYANILCGTFNGVGDYGFNGRDTRAAWNLQGFVPQNIAEGSYETQNRYVIDHPDIKFIKSIPQSIQFPISLQEYKWRFSFFRNGTLQIDIPQDDNFEAQLISGTWSISGKTISINANLADGSDFSFSGEFVIIGANYILVKGQSSITQGVQYFELPYDVKDYKVANQKYTPDYNTIFYSADNDSEFKWVLGGITPDPFGNDLLHSPYTTYTSPVSGESFTLTKQLRLSLQENGTYTMIVPKEDGDETISGHWRISVISGKTPVRRIVLTHYAPDTDKDSPTFGQPVESDFFTGEILDIKSNYLRIKALKDKCDMFAEDHILEFPYNLPGFDINSLRH